MRRRSMRRVRASILASLAIILARAQTPAGTPGPVIGQAVVIGTSDVIMLGQLSFPPGANIQLACGDWLRALPFIHASISGSTVTFQSAGIPPWLPQLTVPGPVTITGAPSGMPVYLWVGSAGLHVWAGGLTAECATTCYQDGGSALPGEYAIATCYVGGTCNQHWTGLPPIPAFPSVNVVGCTPGMILTVGVSVIQDQNGVMVSCQ